LCADTAIDAYQRNLDVIIPKQAVGSYDRSHEDISLRCVDGKIASVVSLDEVASRIYAQATLPHAAKAEH
jgi:isochorismate hydrolase